MGKTTDKNYITHSEWSNAFGGISFGGVKKRKEDQPFKRLPFFCCCLSFQPVSNPVCAPDGSVFDLSNIVPFLQQFHIHPVTGESLDLNDLFKIIFHKNSQGEYHCPLTFKVFTDHMRIAVIKSSGNVYCMDAIEELNIKPKQWNDPLTGESFLRTDIVDIQNPKNVEKQNFMEFYHVTKGIKVKDSAKKEELNDPMNKINANRLAMRVLTALEKSEPKKKDKAEEVLLGGNHLDTHYSDNQMAASFTSTATKPLTQIKLVQIRDDSKMYKQIKERGYVKFSTNYGDITFELFCNLVPMTCQNFIALCQSGYYNSTSLHRLLKGFMIQGGDPTGTGRGGKSCWGKEFDDEFHPQLSHNARGILSMANRGKNTNTSQFFITFDECTHLDQKHSVFGKIVNGLQVLDAVEGLKTDSNDKPIAPVLIQNAVTLSSPFDNLETKKFEREKSRTEKRKLHMNGTWMGPNIDRSDESVGKYLKAVAVKHKKEEFVEPPKKKAPKKTVFGDFSSW